MAETGDLIVLILCVPILLVRKRYLGFMQRLSGERHPFSVVDGGAKLAAGSLNNYVTPANARRHSIGVLISVSISISLSTLSRLLALPHQPSRRHPRATNRGMNAGGMNSRSSGLGILK